jgi:osmotically-inducible protein OsmY
MENALGMHPLDFSNSLNLWRTDSTLVTAEIDRDLERRVINYLLQRCFHTLRRVDVEARDGKVTLRGEVPSFYAPQVCFHNFQRVSGVSELSDQLEVRDAD